MEKNNKLKKLIWIRPRPTIRESEPHHLISGSEEINSASLQSDEAHTCHRNAKACTFLRSSAFTIRTLRRPRHAMRLNSSRIK